MRVLPPLLGVVAILLAAILPSSVLYAQAQTVDLRLSPAATSTASGGALQLIVQVEPNGQQVNGADVCITFPVALLQVTQVQPATSTFATVLANSVDNTNGVIKYSAGTFGAAPTATFTVATIDLQAASANDVASVAFSTSASVCGATPTDAVFGANSVLRNTFGSTVTIGNPPPSAPTGLQATAGNGQVTLTWNAVSGATSYVLYMAEVSFTVWSSGLAGAMRHDGLTDTTFVHTGLPNGVTQFFRVAAVGSGGEGPMSAQVSATPFDPSATPTPTPAATPTPTSVPGATGWGLIAAAGALALLLAWRLRRRAPSV